MLIEEIKAKYLGVREIFPVHAKDSGPLYLVATNINWGCVNADGKVLVPLDYDGEIVAVTTEVFIVRRGAYTYRIYHTKKGTLTPNYGYVWYNNGHIFASNNANTDYRPYNVYDLEGKLIESNVRNAKFDSKGLWFFEYSPNGLKTDAVIYDPKTNQRHKVEGWLHNNDFYLNDLRLMWEGYGTKTCNYENKPIAFATKYGKRITDYKYTDIFTAVDKDNNKHVFGNLHGVIHRLGNDAVTISTIDLNKYSRKTSYMSISDSFGEEIDRYFVYVGDYRDTSVIGILDENFNILVEPKYTSVGTFSLNTGLCKCVDRNNAVEYIDMFGNVVQK